MTSDLLIRYLYRLGRAVELNTSHGGAAAMA
jgi:hypothetical protein